MTLKLRRALLYLLIAVFLFLGGGLIFYAQGWRLDFKALSWTKVGGIYVRSFPQEARIFLDGREIANKSSFIQAGTFIGNLFPRNYRLLLARDGFRPLQRDVAVEPSLVTQLEHAVLVPEKAAVAATTTFQNFWLAGGIVAQDAQGTLKLRGQTLAGDTLTGWSEDFDRLLAFDSRKAVYFWNDPANTTSTNLSALIRKLGLKTASAKLFPDPASDNRVIYLSPLLLAVIDIQRGEFSRIAAVPATSTLEISAAAADASWMAWSLYNPKTGTSTLGVYDRTFRTSQTVPDSIAEKTTLMKRAPGPVMGLAQDNGEFYLLRPANDSLTHLASDVQDFEFSLEADKVALLGSRGLEIFSLPTPASGEGYSRFNLGDAPQITGIAWYKDSEHLFVRYPDKTNFLDLSDAGLQDFTEAAPSGKSLYDPRENILYYLEDGQLFSLEFPD